MLKSRGRTDEVTAMVMEEWPQVVRNQSYISFLIGFGYDKKVAPLEVMNLWLQ